MHLSLFREYLDLEFSSLRPVLAQSQSSIDGAQGAARFEYDLERIIDDFILLNIFVGNDFLPHLPGLHINEGALNRLFEIYKRVLPKAGQLFTSFPHPESIELKIVLDRWLHQRTRKVERRKASIDPQRARSLRARAL